MTIQINELVIRAEISKPEEKTSFPEKSTIEKEVLLKNMMKKIAKKDKRER